MASLCLDCIVPQAARRSSSRARVSPAELFRAGAGALAWGAGAALTFAYFKYGWSGPWRLVAVLLDPTVTLALVPLAFLLGTVRIGLVRALRRILSARSRPSS
ncbi:MAG TPA: hypothetical protein VGB13_07545 [Candidatus Krumholzibacteria bacterium]